MDQAVVVLSGPITKETVEGISQEEKIVLRELAAKLVELAARPSEEAKIKLWYAHNDLKTKHPVIFCDPENGWNEIITEEQMKCQSALARKWEMYLRKEIFWGESMKDDKVIEPVFYIQYVADETDWGLHEERIGVRDGGAYRWVAPVKDYSDIEKLRYPEVRVYPAETEKVRELAEEIFGGILEIRLKGIWWWSLGMTTTLIYLRGLEQVMIDMHDEPEGLHSLMKFIQEGFMRKLDFLEDNGLLSLNNDNTYVGSGGYGWTHELPAADFTGKVRALDMWGFGESQETSLVSAEMFDEYIFTYQLPLLSRFGLNCYGCCEPLDKRWDVVKRVPGLRRVSVSPWSDPAGMAEKLGDKYIYSYNTTASNS